MEGDAGRPYAPFRALRHPCGTSMSKLKPANTTYPHSPLLEGGTRSPYAPFGALRHPSNTPTLAPEPHDHIRNHSPQEGLEPTAASSSATTQVLRPEALSVQSRNRSEINTNPRLNPKVSFFVLPCVPGSLGGPPRLQNKSNRDAKRHVSGTNNYNIRSPNHHR